jgi:D-sedoheptulose 7-phosphate isomerase
MSKQRILGHFHESAELKIQAAERLSQPVSQAAGLMFAALSNGNRIFACGNGGSAAISQYFAAALIGCFERERLPLPAMALAMDTSMLSSLGNDYSFTEIYARQVQAFGQSGDVLLVISSTDSCPNVNAAIEAAVERDMRIIALTGENALSMTAMLTDTDVHICVPHDRVARLHEMHLLIINCLCDGIDVALFGGDAE